MVKGWLYSKTHFIISVQIYACCIAFAICVIGDFGKPSTWINKQGLHAVNSCYADHFDIAPFWLTLKIMR
jgi:hypothetical protein